ncbi:hypothetical protein O0I10_011791 [Lichtheimia ornata]|uniref:Heterokaryon incompatibility domain-containing protein n=1 Tax=Lichtheimia ornata TaxID=688661 RepID=A0AAD7UUN2_9FUNG|nr:uncharacterized protein O0I10_011791 [Lichtheimia ornata]KAJ8652586.1 hypothetical protein O0I10_011791 [Lichtheimia ornata]
MASPQTDKQTDNTFQHDVRGYELLEHPHFLLVYVPNNGAKMRLVKPSSDPYHREQIIQRINKEDNLLPHYALSHLWGISHNNPHVWKEIGDYVDDENGQPAAPVSMRPKKRKTLRTLLQSHPDSYWWIDVLCARTDTPLAIMGDIYACCKQCYAMIDCRPDIITSILSMKHRSEESDPASWSIYEHNVAVNTLETFTSSNWWRRVWTWQEAVLPKAVILMAETLPDDVDDNNSMLSIGDLITLYDKILLSSCYYRDTVFGPKPLPNRICYIIEEIRDSRDRNHLLPIGLVAMFKSFALSARKCMDPLDYVYGVLGLFRFDISRKSNPNEAWHLFISELENYLVDPSRIKIENVYQREIAYKLLNNCQACHCNLMSAKDMRDVYECLVDGFIFLDD